MSIKWANIDAATRLEPPRLKKDELSELQAVGMRFGVPLVHNGAAGGVKIELHADLVSNPDPASDRNAGAKTVLGTILHPGKDTLCVYLCGGPGDSNLAFKNQDLTRELLRRFGPVLYVDYRGTGGSSVINQKTIEGETGEVLAKYMAHFRQDSIVADFEAIRKYFSKDYSKNHDLKFVLVGQSYGGWIAMTYLSYLPNGLAGAWLFGGMPPIGKRPVEVYRALYKRLVQVNKDYFKEYPQDKARVMQIVEFLSDMNNGRGYLINEKTGERLTARGFLTIGRHLGGENGLEKVHLLVEAFSNDVDGRKVSDATIKLFKDASWTGFKLPERPLYGVFHESIYCFGPGVVSNWAAQQVGREQNEGFSWLRGGSEFDFSSLDKAESLFFSAEMIYEFMLVDAGEELKPFIEAADKLATKEDWPQLYDTDALKKNKVEVKALMYPEDLYVDLGLSEETAAGVGNCKAVRAGGDRPHGSVKTRPRETFEHLIKKLAEK